MKIVDVERHRYNKGRILKLIAEQYPGDMDVILMRKVLANLNLPLSHRDICAYITYLEQVGYVKVKRIDMDGNGEEEFNEISLAACTTKGLNFLDNLLKDPDPGVLRITEL